MLKRITPSLFTTCEWSGDCAINGWLLTAHGGWRWLVKCTHAPERKSSVVGRTYERISSEYSDILPPTRIQANIRPIFANVGLDIRGRDSQHGAN
eukprot:7218913-Prymnesium_polylepis.1